MRARKRTSLGHIYHSTLINSLSFHPKPLRSLSFSTSTAVTAIFKSFKRKLAAGRRASTPRSLKSYAETCASLIRRCSCSHRFLAGLGLHGHALKCGISSDRSVFTKLLVMYSECGRPADRDRVFAEFGGYDIFSWNFTITDFSRRGYFDVACKLFEEMPMRNVVSWTIMVDELMKRGRVLDAIRIFERCPSHTVVSYTAMINGFARNGMNLDGLALFREMLRNGFMPNEITFTCVIRACICSGAFYLANSVVGMIAKSMFFHNLSVNNSLITLYLRMGDVDSAKGVFNSMVDRDVVTWTAMLDVCFEMGDVMDARRLFDEMPEKNEVTWSMMIARYSHCGEPWESLVLFSLMHLYGYRRNLSSFASVISASASLNNLLFGSSVHSHVMEVGFEDDVFISSSLIDMYSKCGRSDEARQIFDSLGVKNIICWNAMVGGYCYNGKYREARNLFKKMPERKAATWNAVISGYVQNERYGDAVEIFNEMCNSGLVPNKMTFSSVLLACANLPSLDKGKNLHAKTFKLGIENETFLATALTDMYAKSGDIESSKIVFSMMPVKNEVSWTTMIQGLADSGLAEEALALFDDMLKMNICPTEQMFLSILFACAHCCLVDKGINYFESMEKTYGITPKERHYTCMVDLLSRAGHLREAEDFILKMPIKPEANTWAALLSGCITHVNDEIGERAAKMLIGLEKERAAGYVLLSNIYASVGKWKDVAEVRALMRETGLKKGGGCSWIQIRDRFHTFYSWDSYHPNSLKIYEVLELLMSEVVP
ncbi:Pentatricopeptide repeat-containing protein [Apostasia shenzhenica]|uniref:Pentatricopeptide repeat-containing protein n=1 Tax=Apostasia shenzhenica TaxID=1088818 RepID=A0A2I0B1P3_9ASPA|nr:Pentatricopeptide repeat-containing protein [Apostasia shenzhenica]